MRNWLGHLFVATGTVSEQVELLFFDAVLHRQH